MMPAWMYLYVLAFCRVFGFMQMMPNISETKLPTGIRFVIYMGLTPFMVPGLLLSQGEDLAMMAVFLLAMKEMLLGLFLGLIVSLPLRLPQLIGDLVDNQRGTAVTAQYNPSSGDESSLLGQLLMWVLVAYFYSEHGFDYLIRILAGSFSLQSVTSYTFGFGDDVFRTLLDITDYYLRLFAILSLPVVAVMMVADLALGTASKFSPSMNVFSLSQPVKATISVAMLIPMHPRIVNASIDFFNKLATDYFL